MSTLLLKRLVPFQYLLPLFALFFLPFLFLGCSRQTLIEESRLEKERKEIWRTVAVDPKTPLVTVRGRVLLPDGTPTAHANVQVTSLAIIRGEYPSYEQSFGGGISDFSPTIKEDGTFQIQALPGINLLVGVSRVFGENWTDQKPFAVEPLCFATEFEGNEIVLQLREVPPLTVTLSYANGEPAPEQSVNWSRSWKAPIGGQFGIGPIKWNGRYSEKTDEEGHCVFYLAPGVYDFLPNSLGTYDQALRQKYTVSVDLKQDVRSDLALFTPKPLTIALTTPNGIPAEKLQLVQFGQFWEKIMEGETVKERKRLFYVEPEMSENGQTQLFLSNSTNYLVATTEDGRFGIATELTAEMGEKIDLTLRPNEQITGILLEKTTGKPLCEQKYFVGLEMQLTREENGKETGENETEFSQLYFPLLGRNGGTCCKNGVCTSIETLKTDKEGRFHFGVPTLNIGNLTLEGEKNSLTYVLDCVKGGFRMSFAVGNAPLSVEDDLYRFGTTDSGRSPEKGLATGDDNEDTNDDNEGTNTIDLGEVKVQVP
ncbi:MAG: hypothetical protein ACRC10_04905 [Thermoguttaceae bacterium]